MNIRKGTVLGCAFLNVSKEEDTEKISQRLLNREQSGLRHTSMIGVIDGISGTVLSGITEGKVK